MEIASESKVVAPNVYRSGFGVLFKEDVKNYLFKVRDIIYPDFGAVSGIILSYLSIGLPENIKNDVFTGVNTLYLTYEHMKDHGLPILDTTKYDMEDLMMYLDNTVGLSLSSMYCLQDTVKMYFCIILDENKIDRYGYNKFSIKFTNLQGLSNKTYLLNRAFIYTNNVNKTKDGYNEDFYEFFTRTADYSKSIMRFRNPISSSIIHILDCIFPEEFKKMAIDNLNIVINSGKIIIAAERDNIRAYEKKKADFKYKSTKYLLPDALRELYADIYRSKFMYYVVYFNKYHFVIDMK
jgi:hypothetical protein